jgi:hypothetical protein
MSDQTNINPAVAPLGGMLGSATDGYRVLLRKNATGEERWIENKGPWSEYLWTEGNFGCDCNRHLFFERSGSQETDEDVECGESAYFAVCVEFADGTRREIDSPNTEVKS